MGHKNKSVSSDDKEYCFQHTTLYTNQTLEIMKIVSPKTMHSSFPRYLGKKTLNASVDKIF